MAQVTETSQQEILEIKNDYANIGDKEILKGVSLTVKKGEIHALMGLNGSGKTTLGKAITGHPAVAVTQGEIYLNGENILTLKAHDRAKRGIFFAFQYPQEIPGVSLANFLRTALNAKMGGTAEESVIDPIEFNMQLKKTMKKINMEQSFANRYVNTGFSGGEKKRAEILQMSVLNPKFAILDEIDSGLDIDALKTIAQNINQIHEEQNVGLIIITHYQRILNYITPDFVHVLMDGKIVMSGGKELVENQEQNGYESVKQQVNG